MAERHSFNAVIEKRQHARLKMPLNVYVNNKGEDGGDCLENISAGGACFYSVNEFQPDDFIMIHFTGESDSPIKNLKFSILGKIVWHGSREGEVSSYGAQFKFYNDPFSIQQYQNMLSAFNCYSS